MDTVVKFLEKTDMCSHRNQKLSEDGNAKYCQRESRAEKE
jgi:hypothetical protein